jgi:hypothetical protein
LPQDTAKQEREQAQAELHLTYRKLDALNDEWRTKYPNFSANSKLVKEQHTILAVVVIFAGFLCLFVAIFLIKPAKVSVSHPTFAHSVGQIAQEMEYEARQEAKEQQIIIGSLGGIILFMGFVGLVYANSGSGLIGESQAHEQKKAAIEKKIAELEQKIQ